LRPFYPKTVSRRLLAVVVCLLTAVVFRLTAADRYEVFSGTISQIEEGRVTVQETGTDEVRTFVINDATKVEGELRVSARVTVGYIAKDDEDVATRIIVRATPKKSAHASG
jgi:hypothetical protein